MKSKFYFIALICLLCISKINAATIPSIPNQTVCYGTTLQDLSENRTDLRWYLHSSGGVPLSTGEIAQSGFYYVSAFDANGESGRTSVEITVNYNLLNTYLEPVSVSGYNCDVVAQTLDRNISTTCFFDADAGNLISSEVPNARKFLPNDRKITSIYSGAKYVLADYSQNNDFRIKSLQSVEIKFEETVNNVNTIYLLAAAGQTTNSFLSVNAVMHFSDGTTQNFNNYMLYDWYNTNPNNLAITDIGRLYRGYIQDYNSNPRLFDLILPINEENKTKTITKIIVTNPNSGSAVANILAVSKGYNSNRTVNVCDNQTISQMTDELKNYIWYTSETGGTPLSNATSYLTTGRYYVSKMFGNCESNRIRLDVITIPTIPPVALPRSFCLQEGRTLADIVVSGTNVKWYATATSTTALPLSTLLSTQSYFVTQNTNGCESNRSEVPIIVKNLNQVQRSQTNVSCFGGANGSATVVVDDPRDVTYLWSSGGGTAATAIGLAAGNYEVTISNGCSVQIVPFTIEEPLQITGSATTTQIQVCNDETVAIHLSSAFQNCTFSWTSVSTNVTGAAAGNGNLIADVLHNTGSEFGTVVYTITPNVNGCDGLPFEQTITVMPTTQVTVTNNSPMLCGSGNTAITMASVTAGTIFEWTAVATGVSGASNGSGNAIVQNLVCTGTTSGTVVYTVTPKLNECAGTPQTVTVVVHPIPVVDTANYPNISLCNGQTFGVDLVSTVPGATFSWTVNSTNVTGAVAGNGNRIADVIQNNTTEIGTLVYTITPSFNGCDGLAFEQTITVMPTLEMTVSNTAPTLCGSGNTAIDISSTTAGTTFEWTAVTAGVSGASDGTGNAIVQNLVCTGTTSGTVVYTVTPKFNGCEGTPQTVTVVVHPIPVVDTANYPNISLCNGQTFGVDLVSTVPGAAFSWTVNSTNITGAVAGNGNRIADVIQNNTTEIGTLVYTITPSFNGCDGLAFEQTITVMPTLEMTVSNTAPTLCGSGNTAVDISSTTAGTIFEWTAVATGVSGASDGTGNAIVQNIVCTGTTSGTVVYTVTPKLNGCTGTSQTVTVVVHPIPVVIAAVERTSFCNGETTNINLSSAVAGTTYAWTVNAVGVTGAVAGTGNQINQELNTTSTADGLVVYTIIPTANGCEGLPITVEIAVHPYITPTFAPIDAICSGTYLAPLPTVSLEGIAGSWQPALNNTASTTYTFTPDTANSNVICYNLGSLSIQVNPYPIAQAVVAQQTICSGGEAVIQITAQTPVTTFEYRVLSSTVEGATDGVGNEIRQQLFNNSNVVGAVVYEITPIALGCLGTPITKTIQVNPIADLEVNPEIVSLCTGSQMTAHFTTNTTGATIAWTALATNVSGAANGYGTELNQTLTTVHPNGGTVTYVVTAYYGNCAGESVSFDVQVKPKPEVFGPGRLVICSGNAAIIALSGNNPDVTFTYEVAAEGVTGASAGTGAIIEQVLETTAAVNGRVVYTITPHLNGCDGQSIQVEVLVHALLNMGLNDAYICYDYQTDQPISQAVLQAEISTRTHEIKWYLDDALIAGAEGEQLTCTVAGTYYYTATDKLSSCVSYSDIAIVDKKYTPADVKVYVDNDFKTGTITVEVEGAGTYTYQMDGGTPQSSPVFAGAAPGVHQIVIQDLEGCTYEVVEARVISFPNFFTPNGDGVNDTWNISALEEQDAIIEIFDRYGVLVKQISSKGAGWDGTKNGIPVVATDYWFVLHFRDGKAQEMKTFRSHIALKR